MPRGRSSQLRSDHEHGCFEAQLQKFKTSGLSNLSDRHGVVHVSSSSESSLIHSVSAFMIKRLLIAALGLIKKLSCHESSLSDLSITVLVSTLSRSELLCLMVAMDLSLGKSMGIAW